MTISDAHAKRLNSAASDVYAMLRTRTQSPSQASLVLMMVLYFIWSESPSKDNFEVWHKWILAELAQMHMDNNPPETKQ